MKAFKFQSKNIFWLILIVAYLIPTYIYVSQNISLNSVESSYSILMLYILPWILLAFLIIENSGYYNTIKKSKFHLFSFFIANLSTIFLLAQTIFFEDFRRFLSANFNTVYLFAKTFWIINFLVLLGMCILSFISNDNKQNDYLFSLIFKDHEHNEESAKKNIYKYLRGIIVVLLPVTMIILHQIRPAANVPITPVQSLNYTLIQLIIPWTTFLLVLCLNEGITKTLRKRKLNLYAFLVLIAFSTLRIVERIFIVDIETALMENFMIYWRISNYIFLFFYIILFIWFAVILVMDSKKPSGDTSP